MNPERMRIIKEAERNMLLIPRNREARERLTDEIRIIAAVKRCAIGNFDDLDYLLEIAQSGNPADNYFERPYTILLPRLRHAMFEYAGLQFEVDFMKMLERWKYERNAKNT